MPRQIKLGIHRKAGAPGDGSDGVSWEITDEIADDASAQQIADLTASYYRMGTMEVAKQLSILQAEHATATGTAAAEPLPVHNGQSYNPDHMRPVNRQIEPPPQQPPFDSNLPPRRREPPGQGWDEYDQRDDRDPEVRQEYRHQQNGRDRPRNGNGRNYGAPKNGRQLFAAASKTGQEGEAIEIAKRNGWGSRLDALDRTQVDYIWEQLGRPQMAGWGGRN